MSHETLRDLRKIGAVGTPRVRGPVRDRVSTEPEPDQGVAGKPRRIGWRIAATVLIVAVFVGVGILIARGARPVDCATLHRQAEYTSDVAVELEGCDLDPTVVP